MVDSAMADYMDVCAELQSVWEQNLVEFLQADLELGVAMLHTAKVSGSPAVRRKLLANVKTVIETVARFEGRISNDATVNIIRDQADQLQRALVLVDGTTIQ
jgi:predicted component of type VI protein secretion system